jgi:hypothetical protein
MGSMLEIVAPKTPSKNRVEATRKIPLITVVANCAKLGTNITSNHSA